MAVNKQNIAFSIPVIYAIVSPLLIVFIAHVALWLMGWVNIFYAFEHPIYFFKPAYAYGFVPMLAAGVYMDQCAQRKRGFKSLHYYLLGCAVFVLNFHLVSAAEAKNIAMLIPSLSSLTACLLFGLPFLVGLAVLQIFIARTFLTSDLDSTL